MILYQTGYIEGKILQGQHPPLTVDINMIIKNGFYNCKWNDKQSQMYLTDNTEYEIVYSKPSGIPYVQFKGLKIQWQTTGNIRLIKIIKEKESYVSVRIDCITIADKGNIGDLL